MLRLSPGTRRLAIPALATALGLKAAPSAAQGTAEEAPATPAPAKSPPTTPVIVAPRLVDDPGVVYPEQALTARFYDRVEVVLILGLDETGAVATAAVERGREKQGFDAAALDAARRLRFEPALRDGTPVPAKIRFRYVFEPPAPAVSGTVVDGVTQEPVEGARIVLRAADGTERTAATDARGAFSFEEVPRGAAHVSVTTEAHTAQEATVELAPGEQTELGFELDALAPLEVEKEPERALVVTVRGERRAPAVSSYTRAEVRQIPGAFGDPFRAIETLPGVTPVASGLPFFYVRSAPPGNVGYFFDGIRVPYLFHIGFGPSVVQPAFVERVDLYPGGYPARYGRFSGGIVAAEGTAPRPEWHGEGNIRIFDAGGMVEAGFDGGRGTVALGGRYSYTAAILSLVAPEVTLDYRDAQVRASYEITPRDTLSLFGFGAYDLLAENETGVERILFGTEFYRVDLRHDHAFDDGNLRTAVTLGLDRTSAGFLSGEQRNVVDRAIAGRTLFRTQLGPRAQLRAGADLAVDVYSVERPKYADPESPDAQDFDEQFPSRTDLATGVWVDCVYRPTEAIEVIPGLRLDLYGSGSATAVGVDPRIAARFSVAKPVRIVHAYGLAHQAPAFIIPIPGITPANLRGGLQRSFQASAGVEVDLDESTMASATLFQNAFFNMSDAIGTSSGDGPPDLEDRSLGSAIGGELYVKRRLTQHLGGFLSYTVSRSLRSIGRERFLSAFDRTHVLNTALAYDLGRGWRAGGRVVFYTGIPEQIDVRGTVPPLRTTSADRTPPFFRLDVRLEKRWRLGQTSWISFIAEVMNTTLSRETFGDEAIGPITIPSIGAEAGF